MPGYDAPVIMAAGAFDRALPLELSADGPIKPPYRLFPGRSDLVSCKTRNSDVFTKLVDAGMVDMLK